MSSFRVSRYLANHGLCNRLCDAAMDFGFVFEAESVKWKGEQLGFTKRIFRCGIAIAEEECCTYLVIVERFKVLI